MKRAQGNMYDFVTHVDSPITGCPHRCRYCYVLAQPGGLKKLDKPELHTPLHNYGKNKTIFIGHQGDMFATTIPESFVESVLENCLKYPANTYLFQTKNPERYMKFFMHLPINAILGTTIETNRQDLVEKISMAPNIRSRVAGMVQVKKYATEQSLKWQFFVTIEPIMQFDRDPFIELIHNIEPTFIAIGADSKKHQLEEPTMEQVLDLAKILATRYDIRKKRNLARLV